ncbi:MAG: peptide chain release factor N(5)-glutamine methyltransferase [Fimbriimonadaceae bacterium]|nr:peptide chain release factor N(5)-glutamine methyltransferase [Fimbriimonadaceae bacterium]
MGSGVGISLGAWITQAAQRLERAGIESPRLEATVLAAHAFGWTRSEVLGRLFDPIPSGSEIEALLERRLQREPLAYLLGQREFYCRTFQVGPGVLIPRQETEVLVEAALEVAPQRSRVADLGTGSGCIGITLALERPDLQVTLIDLSPDALSIARRNAEQLGAKVEIHEGDGIEFFEASVSAPPSVGGWRHRDKAAFDLVVTNPPYVAFGDPLPPEVADHEPALALYAGEDGMAFYRRLAASSAPWVLTEIGDGQSAAVAGVFEGHGWRLLSARNDLSGTPRVLEFRRGGLNT